MAWNQPGNQNNNPWGKKPAAGGGDFDQAFKDFQKRIESMFGGGGGRSATPLLIIGIIIIAIWMSTGFYQVKTGEQGVVQRFGKHVDTVGDGLIWRLPWPIETLTKVDVNNVTNTSYKARVLTAEPNMVELEVKVQYRIKDAENYLFKVREPKETLDQVSESAIREVVGRSEQQAILSAGRLKIAEDTREIMQRTLDQYGTGIEVQRVNITDVQVPEAVQQAQRDSVKAQAEKEQAIKAAQAYANGIVPQAEGRAARALQEGRAYKAKLTATATGDAARFSQLAAAYEKAPNVTRERLYIEAVESVLRNSRKVIVDAKNGNGSIIYLPLDKLIDRTRDTESSSIQRPSVSVEPVDAVTVPDPRQRPER